MALRHRLLGSFAALLVLAACSDDTTPSSPSGPSAPGPAADVPVALKISGPDTASVGASASLSVEARDSIGQVVSAGTVTWSSSDSTLIAVSAGGTVTPRRIGTVRVTATAGLLHDTLSFTSSLAPYTFVFPDSVSPADRQTIRDGIQYAHAFHQSALGRVIHNPTTVSGVFSAPGCAAGGSAAFTGAGAVTFCLGNPGWTQLGPIMRQKVVQHELFHVWQFEVGWISNPATSGATWIIEGSAEWMGFRGIEARNLLSFDTGLGCQIKESSDFAARMPPGLPPLSSVETHAAFQMVMGPIYTTSMLGMQDLLATSGAGALKVYGEAVASGTEWHAAFQTAFGVTLTAFYSQFPNYVSSQPVPPNYLCGI